MRTTASLNATRFGVLPDSGCRSAFYSVVDRFSTPTDIQTVDAYLAFAFHPVNAVLGEGIKTIPYEVADQLGESPDVVVTATGGGDNLAAQYRGIRSRLTRKRSKNASR